MTYNLKSGVASRRDLIDGGLSITGKEFHLDPANNTGSASDGNEGKVDAPFLTSQAAINACEDDRGDVIWRHRGYEAVTTPVLFNKAGVSYIAHQYGMNQRQAEAFGVDSTATTGPAAIISKTSYIYGINFSTANVTKPGDGRANNAGTNSAAAVYFLGEGGSFNGGFSHLESCRFPDWVGGQHWGIEFGAGASNLIQNCTFEGQTSGIVFGGTSNNNPIDNAIEDCWFQDLTNGIEMLPGTTQDGLIKGNIFMDISGFAIDLNGTGGGGIIVDNYYEDAVTAVYSENSAANMRTAGWHQAGNHYRDT